MVGLVIFDMDGVLADTERAYRRMNLDFLEARGHQMTDGEYDAFIGIHALSMWQEWKDRFGLPETVEALVEMEKDAKHRLLRDGPLQAVEGAQELLEELKRAGLVLAVASSSLRKNVDLVLNRLDITSYFSGIVAGNQVRHGKPDPEIFLKAASRLGFEPVECAVIEDSRNGVIAAKAAGMLAIGVQREASGGQDLFRADVVVHHLSEITAATFQASA